MYYFTESSEQLNNVDILSTLFLEMRKTGLEWVTELDWGATFASDGLGI